MPLYRHHHGYRPSIPLSPLTPGGLWSFWSPCVFHTTLTLNSVSSNWRLGAILPTTPKKMLTLLQLLKIIIPASTILSAGGSFPRHGEIQQQIIVRGHIIITTSSSHDQCFEAIVRNTVEVWSGRPEDVAKIVECCWEWDEWDQYNEALLKLAKFADCRVDFIQSRYVRCWLSTV